MGKGGYTGGGGGTPHTACMHLLRLTTGRGFMNLRNMTSGIRHGSKHRQHDDEKTDDQNLALSESLRLDGGTCTPRR